MNIIKKWYFWIILILIIGLIVLIILLNKKEDKGVGTAGISKAEFDKIQLGMSEYDVHGIIDELNEWNDNDIYAKCCEKLSDNKNNNTYIYQYKYYGEKNGYAIITYEYNSNNSFLESPKVVKKENFNLK